MIGSLAPLTDLRCVNGFHFACCSPIIACSLLDGQSLRTLSDKNIIPGLFEAVVDVWKVRTRLQLSLVPLTKALNHSHRGVLSPQVLSCSTSLREHGSSPWRFTRRYAHYLLTWIPWAFI